MLTLAIIQKEHLATGENIKILLEENESINETEFKRFNSHSVQLQSPFIFGKTFEIKKERGILFTIDAELEKFKNLQNQIISRDKFFQLALQLVNIMKTVKDPENLLLDLEYMYIDAEKDSIKIIYLPIINNYVKYNVANFFKEYLHIFKLKKGEVEFASAYFQYFKKLQYFSLKNFEVFLTELSQAKQVVKKEIIVEKQDTNIALDSVSYDILNAVQQDTLESVVASASQLQTPQEETYTQIQHRFCTECGTKLLSVAKFCFKCGQKLNFEDQVVKQSIPLQPQQQVITSSAPQHQLEINSQDIGGTTVLGEHELDTVEGTTVLGVAEETTIKAYIKRQSTNSKICIENDAFILGKDPQRCHFLIDGNKAISRTHAKIEMKQGRYYLVDCNSTNKSYVDGQQLTPNQPFEIFNGANIRLANEDFYFILE